MHFINAHGLSYLNKHTVHSNLRLYNLAKNDIIESHVGCWVKGDVSKHFSELLILTKPMAGLFRASSAMAKRRKERGEEDWGREEKGGREEEHSRKEKWKNQPLIKKRQIIDLRWTTNAKIDLYDYLRILS